MFKRYTAFMTALVMILLCFGAMPVSAETTTTLINHFEVGNEGLLIEAESLTRSNNNTQVSTYAGASGGKVLETTSTNTTAPTEDEAADIELNFTAKDAGTYTVWLRVCAPGNGGGDSWFVGGSQFANGWQQKYKTLTKGEATAYNEWIAAYKIEDTGKTISQLKLQAGDTFNVKIRRREARFRIDQIIVTNDAEKVPPTSGDVVTSLSTFGLLVPISGMPTYNPPTEHPRLLFTKKDIPKIKANLASDNENLSTTISRFNTYATGTFTVSGSQFTESYLHRIEAKALYYALYKNDADATVKQNAITYGEYAITKLKDTITKWTNYSSTETRERAGRHILAISFVYDWCYDLLDADEKRELRIAAINLANKYTEMKWPPVGNGATMNSHDSEGTLLRDLLAFSIATYNERPDYWNYVAGRFYNEYIDERVWETQTNIHHEGTDYGFMRTGYNLWAYQLITRMGLSEPYDGRKFANYAYTHQIYARRPDGSQFIRGDMWAYAMPAVTSDKTDGYTFSEHLLNAASISGDPYIYDEYYRNAAANGADHLAGPVIKMIFIDPSVEPSPISELPLSRYSPEPGGIMYARTGWQTGFTQNSETSKYEINKTAAVQLNIGYTWQTLGHSHRDLGDFSIYYQGPLVSPSGNYYYVQTPFDHGYLRSSTAHNTLLVYDPSEPDANFLRMYGDSAYQPVNDGGQMIKPKGTYSNDTFARIMSDESTYKVSEVVGHEIDPKNPDVPEYTYLSGDLTNAYWNQKVSDYKRSFMFLNFGEDEAVPAALIVFDKVTSPKTGLKRTWLMHGQTDPVFENNGSRTIWGSESREYKYSSSKIYKYSGKMVADHLLPATSTKVVKAGNNTDGFRIGEGEEEQSYINEKAIEANRDEKFLWEVDGYRIEISETEGNESHFLNCMQVMNENNTEYLATELIDIDDFYGVKISDRKVLFAKNAERQNKKITLTSDGTQKYKYTICDLEAGLWLITVGKQKSLATVTEAGGVLAFEKIGANITVEPYSGDAYDYPLDSEIIEDDGSDDEEEEEETVEYIDLVDEFGAAIEQSQHGGSNAYTDLDADASTNSKWVFKTRAVNGMGRTFKITGLSEASLEDADIRYVEFSMNFKQLSDKTHSYIDFRAKGTAKPNLAMALTSGYVAQTNYINIGQNAVNDVRIIRDRETKTTYLYINNLLAAMYVFTDGTTTTALDGLYEFGFAFYGGGTETAGSPAFEVTRMNAKGWTSDATADDMKIYNGYIKNGMVWRSMGKAITNLSTSTSATNSNLSVTCHIPAYQDGILKRAFGATSQTTGADISGFDVSEAYMWNTTTMEPYSMPTGVLSLD